MHRAKGTTTRQQGRGGCRQIKDDGDLKSHGAIVTARGFAFDDESPDDHPAVHADGFDAAQSVFVHAQLQFGGDVEMLA